MAQITNFADQIRGDVFEEKVFELYYQDISKPIILTGCSILMTFRLRTKIGKTIKTLSIGSGITIIDEYLGKFKIDRSVSFLPYSDMYFYDLQITFPRGEIKTYLQGAISVKQDVSF